MSSLGTLWAEGQVSWRGTRFLRLMLQDSTVASPRERVRSKPQILRGCEADLVRHGQGGWARRRASAGREVGPLPGLCPAAPRASEPPVSGWQPSRGPAPAGPGGRRSPRGPLPTHVPHSAGTGRAGRGGPGSGLGPRAARRRGRRRSVHPRLHRAHARQTPAAAFQGASREAGAGLWGADQLPEARGQT